MKLHHNHRARLLVETLEDRLTPSSVTALYGDGFCPAAPAGQPAVQTTLEKKDFSLRVENPMLDSAIGSASTDGPELMGWDIKENKPGLADQPTVQATVDAQRLASPASAEAQTSDAFIAFEGMDGQEEPVLAGYNLKETKLAAPADQTPVPAAVDAFIVFEEGLSFHGGFDIKSNVKV